MNKDMIIIMMLVLFFIMMLCTDCNVSWATSEALSIGEVEIFSGENYHSRHSLASEYQIVFNQTTFSNNPKIAFSMLEFVTNRTADFGYKTNITTITLTGAEFSLELLGETVLKKLRLSYMAMDDEEFSAITTIFEGSTEFNYLSKGSGMRSENISILLMKNNNSIENPYNNNIFNIIFLNSFWISNPNGSHFSLDWEGTYNRTHYTCEFFTEGTNKVIEVDFVVFVAINDATTPEKLIYEIGSLEISSATEFYEGMKKMYGFNKIDDLININNISDYFNKSDTNNNENTNDSIIRKYEKRYNEINRFYIGLSGFNVIRNKIFNNSKITHYINIVENYKKFKNYLNSNNNNNDSIDETFNRSNYNQNENESYYVNYIDRELETAGVDKIKISYILLAVAECESAEFFHKGLTDCVDSCSGDFPFEDSSKGLCLPCHYSCDTCNGPEEMDCLTCPETRELNETETCECKQGYLNVFEIECQPCDKYIKGCSECSDYENCTVCKTGLEIGNNSECVCENESLSLTENGECVDLVACLRVFTYPNGTVLCLLCNSTANFMLYDFECVCKPGSYLPSNDSLFDNETSSAVECEFLCGDGVYTKENNEECDDGNDQNDDGCSKLCMIEEGYVCLGELEMKSNCVINETLKLIYLGALRPSSENVVNLYFKITPYHIALSQIKNLTDIQQSIWGEFPMISENSNRSRQFSFKAFELSFPSDLSSGNLLISIEYSIMPNPSKDKNNTILLNLTKEYLHLPTSTSTFKISSSTNYELTLSNNNDDKQSTTTPQKFEIILLSITLIIGLLTTYVCENWISGVELIQTSQMYFFYLLCVDWSNQIENMQYVDAFKLLCGFLVNIGDVSEREYFYYYEFNEELYRMGYAKELFYNVKVTLLIMLVPVVLIAVKCFYKLTEKKNKKTKTLVIVTTTTPTTTTEENKYHYLLKWKFIMGNLLPFCVLIISNQLLVSVYIESTSESGYKVISHGLMSNKRLIFIEYLLSLLVLFILFIPYVVLFWGRVEKANSERDVEEGYGGGEGNNNNDNNNENNRLLLLNNNNGNDNNVNINNDNNNIILSNLKNFSLLYPFCYVSLSYTRILALMVFFEESYALELFLGLEISHVVLWAIWRPYSNEQSLSIEQDIENNNRHKHHNHKQHKHNHRNNHRNSLHLNTNPNPNNNKNNLIIKLHNMSIIVTNFGLIGFLGISLLQRIEGTNPETLRFTINLWVLIFLGIGICLGLTRLYLEKYEPCCCCLCECWGWCFSNNNNKNNNNNNNNNDNDETLSEYIKKIQKKKEKKKNNNIEEDDEINQELQELEELESPKSPKKNSMNKMNKMNKTKKKVRENLEIIVRDTLELPNKEILKEKKSNNLKKHKNSLKIKTDIEMI